MENMTVTFAVIPSPIFNSEKKLFALEFDLKLLQYKISVRERYL